ncbi:MAG: hypothetical protein FJX72_21055, partial [Armatimonadetes bacterium]|nr:hypothetical protein [Armatimonadota bacterium]
MMRVWGMWAAFCTLAAAAPALGQQVLLTESFDTDNGQWTTMGGAGKVTVVKDATQAKVGTGALRYDYTVRKGEPTFLLHPITSPPPESVKGFRFWVKTDAPTWLALILQERGGPRYTAAFQTLGGAYQQVEIGLGDFGPGLDKDDPKDPNNKLDIAEVEGLGFLDMAVMLAEDGSGQLLKLIGLKDGARTLWLDEIEVLTALSPETTKAAENEVVVDGPSKPCMGWLVTGWAKPSIVSGPPLGARSLKLDYKRNAGELAGMIRFLPKGKLDGTTALALKAASIQATTLLVQVEEVSGGKYNALVELGAGSQVKDTSIPWAEFTADGESKDDNGK